jgi:hypothetical protein
MRQASSAKQLRQHTDENSLAVVLSPDTLRWLQRGCELGAGRAWAAEQGNAVLRSDVFSPWCDILSRGDRAGD